MEVGQTFSRYFRRLQEAKHMSMLVADSLDFLSRNPDCTMTELADYLRATRPAVTSLMRTLQRKGFVLRLQDEVDRRKYRLQVTEDGQAELIRIRQLMREEFQKIFSVLTREEFMQYAALNSKIVASMQALMRDYYQGDN